MTLLKTRANLRTVVTGRFQLDSMTGKFRPQHTLRCIPLLAGLLMATGFADASDSADSRHLLWYEDGSWIRDIGVLLSNDKDRDGYFSGLVLTVEADSTEYREHVYITIDLIDSQQRLDPLHTSDDFTIYRNNISNEYRVEIDLVSNYVSDRYDMQISLRDADSSALLDTVGAAHFSNLSLLPLESEDFDLNPDLGSPGDVDRPANDERPITNENIRVTEYTGSSSWMMIIILLVCFFCRSATLPRWLNEDQLTT